MILYRLNEGLAYQEKILYRPRTCFLMTQLGDPVPPEVDSIREKLKSALEEHDVALIDADSEVTGGDFLFKIWQMIVAVPLAVAVVHEEMPTTTQCNVFYEVGLAHALGKESIVIKTPKARIPSDFVRTEYIKYDPNFEQRMKKYLDNFFKQGEWYELVAEQVERNPLLAIDYLRRAFLISGDTRIKAEVANIRGDFVPPRKSEKQRRDPFGRVLN
ncbi:MAG: hypothetical protein H0U65_09305 [Rubrobacter sp.]|nr:hypothetical protein [Rubrobacter sp.]